MGGVMAFGVERHRDAICERGRANALVSVIDDFNRSASANVAGPVKP